MPQGEENFLILLYLPIKKPSAKAGNSGICERAWKIRGEGGIRTLGRLASTPVFETGPIGRSGTSPDTGHGSEITMETQRSETLIPSLLGYRFEFSHQDFDALPGFRVAVDKSDQMAVRRIEIGAEETARAARLFFQVHELF